MATLIDWTDTLVKLNTGGVELLYKKVYCTCEVDGDFVLFFAHQVETNKFRQQYRILYSDFTNPTGASAVDVKAAIDAIIENYVGAGASDVYYGAYYDSTTQTSGGATSENIMQLGGVFEENGVSVDNADEITVANDGTYNLQFSAQFEKGSGADAYVQIWLKLNGNNIADSNTEIQIHHNGGTYVAAWNFVITLDAGDYLQLAWHSDSTSVQLLAQLAGSSPTRPAIPSVIVTLTQVMGVTGGGGIEEKRVMAIASCI
jgi:hypothetical protein